MLAGTVLALSGCFDASGRFACDPTLGADCPADPGSAAAGAVDGPDAVTGGDAGGGLALPITNGSVSQYSACVVRGGQLWCWGANRDGAFGQSSTRLPTAENPLLVLDGGVEQVEVGFGAICVRTVGGEVRCAGTNYEGMLSRPGAGDSMTFLPIEGVSLPLRHLSFQNHHACVVDVSGHLWCWGEDLTGQLGLDGGSRSVATAIAMNGLAVSRVVAGHLDTCVLTQTGEVWCQGLMTRRAFPGAASPTRVSLPGQTCEAVSLGAGVGCALCDGGVRCWGESRLVGRDAGVADPRAEVPPGPVALPAQAMSIACGLSSTCASTRTGQVWCWGVSTDGSLGDAELNWSIEPSQVPPPLPGGVSWLASGAVATASCAVTGSQDLWCWGTKLHRSEEVDPGGWLEPRRFDFHP